MDSTYIPQTLQVLVLYCIGTFCLSNFGRFFFYEIRRYVLLCILGGPRNLNETHHKLRHIVVQVQVLVVTALSLRSSKDYYGVARKDELHDDNGRRSG